MDGCRGARPSGDRFPIEAPLLRFQGTSSRALSKLCTDVPVLEPGELDIVAVVRGRSASCHLSAIAR